MGQILALALMRKLIMILPIMQRKLPGLKFNALCVKSMRCRTYSNAVDWVFHLARRQLHLEITPLGEFMRNKTVRSSTKAAFTRLDLTMLLAGGLLLAAIALPVLANNRTRSE